MADTLTIVTPAAYQTYQRNSSDLADIPLVGTFTGGTPVAIEARWRGGAWTTLSHFLTSGSGWSGNLAGQSAGQGTLEIRDVDTPAATDSVATIGIGDVFLVCGQSNAAGELDNFQTYTGDYVATMWSFADDEWAELADPTGANTAQGSVWPLLATLLMADQDVPIAFIPTAVGSTSLVSGSAHWAKNNARYADAVARYTAAAPNGLRCILWYQGESDALAGGVTAAAYQTALSLMLDDFQADLNLPSVQLVAALIGSVFTEPDADIDAIRLATIDRWNNDADVLAGPVAYDQTFADGVHWFSDAQAAILANRWLRCLKAHFYGGALEPARGPQFISASRTGTAVTVRFDVDVPPLLGQANATGWAYTDDGTPVAVSSAASSGSDKVILSLGGTPTGVELLYWCSGDDGAGGQLRDSGAIAEVPPEPIIGAAVTATPSGDGGGRNWYR